MGDGDDWWVMMMTRCEVMMMMMIEQTHICYVSVFEGNECGNTDELTSDYANVKLYRIICWGSQHYILCMYPYGIRMYT